ncbi:hypothetical protein ACLUEY_01220 [Vreelandella aquamarina]
MHLNEAECMFLKQMHAGSEDKLLESRPYFAAKPPFNKAEKRAAIDRLLELGYLSGQVTINDNGSFNYQGISATDKGYTIYGLFCMNKT